MRDATIIFRTRLSPWLLTAALLAPVGGPGRRLAAVARPAARRRLARDGHPRQVPRRRAQRSAGEPPSAAATPGPPSPAAGSTSPTASSPRRGQTRTTPSPEDQPRAARSASSASTRPPARSSGSTSTTAPTPSPTPAARGHAGRPRRQGLHARRDGRPALPRRGQGQASSGRRTSRRTTRPPSRSGASRPTRCSTATASSAWSAARASVVVAFDKDTGKEKWQRPRRRRTQSSGYCPPMIFKPAASASSSSGTPKRSTASTRRRARSTGRSRSSVKANLTISDAAAGRRPAVRDLVLQRLAAARSSTPTSRRPPWSGRARAAARAPSRRTGCTAS